jgi:exodeoxyribonuclease VII large subunit
MEMAMDYYLAQRQQQFTRINHRLQQQHPHLRLARQQTLLFKLQRRLEDGMQNQLRLSSRRSDRVQQRLAQVQPQARIHRYQQRVQQQEYRLQQALERQLNAYRQRFGVACSQLEAVSPLATLARGYSVTQTPRGEVLKTTKQAQVGELLKTRLQDGWVESEVKTITVAKKPRKKRAANAAE